MVEAPDRLRARMATLRAVSRALARPLDVVGVLRAMHAELARALDVTICFFGLYDAASETVEVIWQMHADQELPGGNFPLGSGPSSQAIRHCQPQLIRNWSSKGPRVQVQYATERPDLPESAMMVPVVFDDNVLGILAVQSYAPDAYDEQDLVLVQAAADQLAVAIVAAQRRTDSSMADSELEAVLASMADAVVVLDKSGRLVRLNQAARELLCPSDGSLILGQPVDTPQAEQWPLGSRSMTEQLRPVVGQLKNGDAPAQAFSVSLDGGSNHRVSCRASVLRKGSTPSGGVVVFHEISPSNPSAARS